MQGSELTDSSVPSCCFRSQQKGHERTSYLLAEHVVRGKLSVAFGNHPVLDADAVSMILAKHHVVPGAFRRP
jgi:hypothetical protein